LQMNRLRLSRRKVVRCTAVRAVGSATRVGRLLGVLATIEHSVFLMPGTTVDSLRAGNQRRAEMTAVGAH